MPPRYACDLIHRTIAYVWTIMTVLKRLYSNVMISGNCTSCLDSETAASRMSICVHVGGINILWVLICSCIGKCTQIPCVKSSTIQTQLWHSLWQASSWSIALVSYSYVLLMLWDERWCNGWILFVMYPPSLHSWLRLKECGRKTIWDIRRVMRCVTFTFNVQLLYGRGVQIRCSMRMAFLLIKCVSHRNCGFIQIPKP